MNIDVKLKTYEQLQFEITKLNTDIFLKNKEIERLNNIINELEKFIKNPKYQIYSDGYAVVYVIELIDFLNGLKELKENNK